MKKDGQMTGRGERLRTDRRIEEMGDSKSENTKHKTRQGDGKRLDRGVGRKDVRRAGHMQET